MTEGPLACVDVGSTFTKAAAIDPRTGALLATAQCPTTSATDVMVGLDESVRRLEVGPVADASLLVCSSAGGGLRLAVVGQERVISAEAGRRVALSAGARVVGVFAGPLDAAGLDELGRCRPDVVLLVGGTDGGESAVVLHNAQVLAHWPADVPIVVAGNAAAAPEAVRLLGPGRLVRSCANVIPRIGTLEPGPARAAIREVFVRHVIGGKHLSPGPRFPRLVICPTPDAVLSGVECLARVRRDLGEPGDVLTIDVGGATTDVFSVLAEAEGSATSAVQTPWQGRTVEGDLGMRHSAPGVLQAARAERMAVSDGLVPAALLRAAEVDLIPAAREQLDEDLLLATLAATIAVRRHARPGPNGVRDLSRVGLVLGSGGVLRHASPAAAVAVLSAVVADVAGGWRVPESPELAVDTDYLLAPVGMLQLAGKGELAVELAGQALRRMLRVGASRSDQRSG